MSWDTVKRIIWRLEEKFGDKGFLFFDLKDAIYKEAGTCEATVWKYRKIIRKYKFTKGIQGKIYLTSNKP